MEKSYSVHTSHQPSLVLLQGRQTSFRDLEGHSWPQAVLSSGSAVTGQRDTLAPSTSRFQPHLIQRPSLGKILHGVGENSEFLLALIGWLPMCDGHVQGPRRHHLRLHAAILPGFCHYHSHCHHCFSCRALFSPGRCYLRRRELIRACISHSSLTERRLASRIGWSDGPSIYVASALSY